MADVNKPGYKTSEFWVTAITGLVAIVNQSGAFHFTIPVDTITQLITAAAVYIGSRSVLKTAKVLFPNGLKAPGAGNN